MSGLATARSYLEWYSATMPWRQAAASEIGGWMKERMRDLGVAVDSVSAREKGINSTRGKVRGKAYARPRSQMTDTIGVRVVLLFDSDIEKVVNYLRSALQVSERHSRRAGEELELAEFGYRSEHLVARWRGRTMPSYTRLGYPWVEIQVRSLLQHAWAAIGHDHLYKGALVYPNAVKRRFYAVAGSLELFDQEFDSIRGYREKSHSDWLAAYQSGKRMGERFDIAGAAALFEWLFPGSKWTNSLPGRPLPVAVEIALVGCLRKAGLATARDLRSLVTKKRFRSRLETYASLVGAAPSEVPNFAKAVLAIAQRRSSLLLRDYEELIEDPHLRFVSSL